MLPAIRDAVMYVMHTTRKWRQTSDQQRLQRMYKVLGIQWEKPHTVISGCGPVLLWDLSLTTKVS